MNSALYDDLVAQLDESRTMSSKARCALAFVRGVLATCEKFNQPITPRLIAAMIKEADDVLEPIGSDEPITEKL